MYERMLDKSIVPTFEEMVDYCGAAGTLLMELDQYMKERYLAQSCIRFPYGNKYGWSMKYSLKAKHICDTFAENGAFALHFHIGNDSLNEVYNGLSDAAKAICDSKYPCGDGGWLTFRVLTPDLLKDGKALLEVKVNEMTHKKK